MKNQLSYPKVGLIAGQQLAHKLGEQADMGCSLRLGRLTNLSRVVIRISHSVAVIT